jgi:hypothetical protein
VGVKGTAPIPNTFWRAMRIAVGDISSQSPFCDLVDGPLAKESPIITYDKYYGKVFMDLSVDMPLPMMEEVATVLRMSDPHDSDDDEFTPLGNCPSL